MTTIESFLDRVSAVLSAIGWEKKALGTFELIWRPSPSIHSNGTRAVFGHLRVNHGGSSQMIALAPGVDDNTAKLALETLKNWTDRARQRFPDAHAFVSRCIVALISPEEAASIAELYTAAKSAHENDHDLVLPMEFTRDFCDTSAACYPCECGRFVIVVPLPQPIRRPADERSWLQSALCHELEHVLQLALLRGQPTDLRWQVFMEASAEAHACLASGVAASLDFAHSLASRAPFGLRGQNPSDLDCTDDGYHAFAFLVWLEQRHEDILDQAWRAIGDRTQESRKGGWWLLHSLLLPNSTLTKEWRLFCEAMMCMDTHDHLKSLHSRVPIPIPALTVDLNRELISIPTIRPSSDGHWQQDFGLTQLTCVRLRITPHVTSSWRLKVTQLSYGMEMPLHTVVLANKTFSTLPTGEHHELVGGTSPIDLLVLSPMDPHLDEARIEYDNVIDFRLELQVADNRREGCQMWGERSAMT